MKQANIVAKAPVRHVLIVRPSVKADSKSEKTRGNDRVSNDCKPAG